MEIEQLKARIEELEKENRTLTELLSRGNTGSSTAYSAIRGLIVEKVNEEIEIPTDLENWQRKHKRQVIERNIMSDLKWDLRVRHISDFRTEHIQRAKDYLQNYVIESEYRKEAV